MNRPPTNWPAPLGDRLKPCGVVNCACKCRACTNYRGYVYLLNGQQMPERWVCGTSACSERRKEPRTE